MKKNIKWFLAVAIIFSGLVAGLKLMNIQYNDTYEIDKSGYTFSNVDVLNFTEGASYQKDGLYKGSSLKLTNGKRVDLDRAETLFYDDGSIELLSNSVALISNQEIFDMKSKTTLTDDGTIYSTSNETESPIRFPKGSIIKLDQGRYLILDKVTIENDQNYSKTVDSQVVLVVVDDNGKAKVVANETVEEVLGNTMVLKLENRFCDFRLTDEYLVCSDEEQSLDLKNITVSFEDTVDSREKPAVIDNGEKEGSENEETVDNGQPTDTTGTGTGSGAGTGSNTGSTNVPVDNGSDIEIPEYPDIHDLIKPDYSLPVVDVVLSHSKNNISGKVSVALNDTELTSLNAVITDSNGTVVQRQTLKRTNGEDSFSFSNLNYQTEYEVRVEGAYRGTKGSEVATTFFRQKVTLENFTLSGSVIDRFEDSLDLDLNIIDEDGQIASFDLGIYKNDGRNTKVATSTVQLSSFTNSNAKVSISNLESNNGYVIKLDALNYNNGNSDSGVAKWYTIGSTTKKLPTVGKTVATIDANNEKFTLNSTPVISDSDHSVVSVRYVGYLESDYAANQAGAVEQVSVMKTAAEMIQDAVVLKPTNIPSGDYVFVTYVNYNDTKENGIVTSTVSDTVVVKQGLEAPIINLTLNKSGMSIMDVDYEVIDTDDVVIYSSSTLPFVDIYEVDSLGNIISGPIEPSINHKTIHSIAPTGTVDFSHLKADTFYAVEYTTIIDLLNGGGQVPYTVMSQPFKTVPVEDHFASFINMEEESETSLTVNLKLTGTYVEELRDANLNAYDSANTLISSVNLANDMNDLITSGKDIIIGGLSKNTDYTLKVEDAKDTGDNLIPIVGDITLQTISQKEQATVEFIVPEQRVSATKLDLNFKITDADDAIIKSYGTNNRIEVLKHMADGSKELQTHLTKSLSNDELMNPNNQLLSLTDLEEDTTYTIQVVVSSDIKDGAGIVENLVLDTSQDYSTVTKEVVTATYDSFVNDGIQPTEIEFNLKLSSYAKHLDSAILKVYEVSSGNEVSTAIDISEDFISLTDGTGVNYKFEGLEANKDYIIRIEDVFESTLTIDLDGGTDNLGNFEFATIDLRDKPTATIDWDQTVDSPNQLQIDYEILDAQDTLDYTAGHKPYIALYLADSYGNPTGNVIEKVEIDSDFDLLGNYLFKGLMPNTSYVAEIVGSFDLGNGILQTETLVTSEVMTTRLPYVLIAEFEEISVGLTEVKYTVEIVDFKELLESGSAQIQFYQYDESEADFIGAPEGPALTLTSAQINDLVQGNKLNLVNKNLKKNTKYIAKFINATDKFGESLQIDGSLVVTTKNEKSMPEIIFSNPNISSSSVEVDYLIDDAEDSLVITLFKPAKFIVFELDDQGNEIESSKKTVKTVYSKDNLYNTDFTGSVEINKLKKNQEYILYLQASYNLDDGQGESNDLLDTPVTFKTTDIQPLNIIFTDNEDEIKTNALTVGIEIENLEEVNIKEGRIQLYNGNGISKIGQPITLNQTQIQELINNSKDFVFDETGIGVELSSNTPYIIRLVEFKDDANNSIPIANDHFVFTKKKMPTIDAVYVTRKEKMEIEATLGLSTQANKKIIDEDLAVSEIIYSLYKEGDTSAAAVKTISDPQELINPYIFDLDDEGLPIGYKYYVTAEVSWNDNYKTHEIQPEFTSDEISMEKEVPEVFYQVVSKSLTNTVVKVTTKDEDESIVLNTLKLKSDSGEIINVTPDEDGTLVTITGDATELTTTADLSLLSGELIQEEELQSLQLLASTSNTVDVEADAQYLNKRIEYEVSPSNSETTNNSIYLSKKIENKNSNKVIEFPNSSAFNIFSKNIIQLPEEDLDIWFTDEDINFDLSQNLVYRENNVEEAGTYTKKIMIAGGNSKGNGLGYNTSSGSYRMVFSSNQMSAFNVVSSTLEANGDISNVKLQEGNTETYLATDINGRLIAAPSSSSAETFIFEILPNGTYVMKTSSGLYLNLANGTSGDKSEATVVQIYSANEVEKTVSTQVHVPKLKAPSFEIKTPVVVYDTRATISYTGVDTDSVLLKNQTNTQYLTYLELYKKDDMTTPVQKIVLTAITNTVNITGIEAATEYVIQIKGSYDLKDGPTGLGEIEEVFVQEEFKTIATLPSVTSSTYKWNSNVWGLPQTANAAHTQGDVKYSDPSGVIEGIEYRWYKAPTGAYDKDNLGEMQQYFEENPTSLVTVFTENAAGQGGSNLVDKPKMDMFDQSITKDNQNYGPDNYVIAVYFKVAPGVFPSLPNTDILVNVNDLLIEPETTDARILLVQPGLGTNSVSLGFQYSKDLMGVLGGTGSTNKPFKYEMTNTKTGAVEHSGEFSLNDSTKQWEQYFDGLEPSTQYRFKVTATKYNDYETVGSREFVYTFTTLKRYVVVNNLAISKSGSDVVASFNSVEGIDSSIESVTLEIWKQLDETDNEMIKLEKRQIVGQGAESISIPDGDGIYFARVVVEYKINGTNTKESYKQDSYRMKF